MAERVLEVDADLRPEGKNGPMVRSLDSYAEYYRRWSLVWEAQALLRAGPMAGDDDLAATSWRWWIRSATRRSCREARRPRDPPDQGAGGVRAAAARRRSGPPPEAGPRRTQRRRMAGPAAAAAARRRAPGAADHLHPAGAQAAAAAWAAARGRRRDAAAGLAAGQPDPVRQRDLDRQDSDLCPPPGATWKRWPAGAATSRGTPRPSRRTICASPGGPGPFSSAILRARHRSLRPRRSEPPAGGDRPASGGTAAGPPGAWTAAGRGPG